MFKGDEKSPEAIVQKVNAEERTAEIQIVGQEETEKSSRESLLVSVLELDPHGAPPDTFGVARGDLVLIGHSSNGCIPPRVPRIGEYDVSTPLEEIRSDLTRLGLSLSASSPQSNSLLAQAGSFLRSSLLGLRTSNSSNSTSTDSPSTDATTTTFATSSNFIPALAERSEPSVNWRFAPGGVSIGTEQDWSMSKDLDSIDWYGEVKDLRLDGKVEVTLPGGRVEIVEHELLSILNEGGDRGYGDDLGPEEGEDEVMEEGDGDWEEMDGSDEDVGGGDDDLIMDEDGEVIKEVDEWGRSDDEEDEKSVAMVLEESSRRVVQEMPAPIAPAVEVAKPASSALGSLPPLPTAISPIHTFLQQQPQGSSSSAPKSKLADSPEWTRFEVLEEAPEDHHFYKSAVGKPNAAFSSRMQKEFKVLASSLPGELVRLRFEESKDA